MIYVINARFFCTILCIRKGHSVLCQIYNQSTTINRKLVGKMSQTDFTLELLGIKDSNITVLNVTNEHINRESICRITSKLTYPVERCANCGYKQVVKMDLEKHM